MDIEGLFALVEERGGLDTEGGCELETRGLDIEGLFALVEERGGLSIKAEWGCDSVEARGRGYLDMDIEGGDSVLEGYIGGL